MMNIVKAQPVTHTASAENIEVCHVPHEPAPSAQWLPDHHGGDPVSPARSSGTAAKLRLAAARHGAGLSGAPPVPGFLDPEYRRQAAFGEGGAGAADLARPDAPCTSIPEPALAPRSGSLRRLGPCQAGDGARSVAPVS